MHNYLPIACHDSTVINSNNQSYLALHSTLTAKAHLPLSNSFWDNGAWGTVVKDKYLFIPSTFKRLTTPIALEGVGGAVLITHCGYLLHLPPPFNKAFYSKDLYFNLFSLGNIQRLGGFYTVNPDNQLQILIKTSVHGKIIATATLADNNLLPFSLPTASSINHSSSSGHNNNNQVIVDSPVVLLSGHE